MSGKNSAVSGEHSNDIDGGSPSEGIIEESLPSPPRMITAGL